MAIATVSNSVSIDDGEGAFGTGPAIVEEEDAEEKEEEEEDC